jgi:hypothetical protein
MTDDGLRFTVWLSDEPAPRETADRRDVLRWVIEHTAVGGTVRQVGMTANASAVAGFLAALALGARKMEEEDTQ